MGLNELILEDKRFELAIHQNAILAAIENMARILNETFENKKLKILVILDGAEPFAKNIIPQFNFEYSIDYLKLKTYAGMKSRYAVNLDPIDLEFARDSELLILEDIIDTGNTLEQLSRFLREKMNCSIHIAALFQKKDVPNQKITADFRGILIENEFVVGFGMDYNEKGRSLEHIYRLKPDLS